jgi:hypothetical protein
VELSVSTLILEQNGKIMSSLPLNCFEADLSTLQKIVSIRGNLHLALTVIVGTIIVLSRLSSHCAAVGESKGVDPELCHALAEEFDLISVEMEMHKSATKRLVNISNDLFLAVRLDLLHLLGMWPDSLLCRIRIFSASAIRNRSSTMEWL